MNNDKLKQLIARQNERLEEDASQQAARIINEIAEYQQAKSDAEKKIVELRTELKKITVASLDVSSILGND